MALNCIKCGGRVFVDRVLSEQSHLELACVICGKRWMLGKKKSGFAKWLTLIEQQYANATSSDG